MSPFHPPPSGVLQGLLAGCIQTGLHNVCRLGVRELAKKRMGHEILHEVTPPYLGGRGRMGGGGSSEVRGLGGLVWFGSRLAPKLVTHGQCARTSAARLGIPPGSLVSQPPRLLTIPVPRQGGGEREIPPCLYV